MTRKTAARDPAAGDGSEKVIAAYWVPLEALVPWVKNPRQNDNKVQEMITSIRRWGFGPPICAWIGARARKYSDGVKQEAGDRIAAGHLRRKAMRQMWEADPGYVLPDAPGPGLVPVRPMTFASEYEFEAFALRENNPLGDYDPPGVKFVLLDMQEGGAELEGLGWTDKEIAEFMAEIPDGDGGEDGGDDSSKVDTDYVVLIDCDSERHQLEIIEKLLAEDYQCRALT